MNILHGMYTCTWLANALRYSMVLYWVMAKSDTRFNFLFWPFFPPDASATTPTTPLHQCRRLAGKNKEDAILIHCFCQSELSLSVPMGEVLNGPDDRVTSPSFQLCHFLTSSPYLSNPCFHCVLMWTCVFVQCLLCLTSIKPFFEFDSKCQTMLISTD